MLRLALYGALPLQGDGRLLSVRVEALERTARGVRVFVEGQADEGRVPLEFGGVRAGGPAPASTRTAAGKKQSPPSY